MRNSLKKKIFLDSLSQVQNMPMKKGLCIEQYPKQIMKSLSDLWIHFHNVLFEESAL